MIWIVSYLGKPKMDCAYFPQGQTVSIDLFETLMPYSNI